MSEIEKNDEVSNNFLDGNEQHLEGQIKELEEKGNQEETDEIPEIEEENRDQTDYSQFSKDDFINKAKLLIDMPNIKEAHEIFKKIRTLFDDIVKKERIEQIKAKAAEGEDIKDFKPAYDEQKETFYKLYTKFLEKRAEEKRLAEEEKQKNLKSKERIINRLKELSMVDETSEIFTEVKLLQQEWKAIRSVPHQFVQDLWDRYRFYIDKFYDNVSINNQLKQKDRENNFNVKIELIKKVTALSDEQSIKRSFILLNKYKEDYRNTGPVDTKELAEDLKNRFKEACDIITNQKREHIDAQNEIKKQNFELKKVLVEKSELISNISYNSPKQWKEKTEEMIELFNQWKQIGPVPESVNHQIWKQFRESQNEFNNNKKHYFNQLNSGKEENLAQKIKLCEEAEKLIESTQFDTTSKLIISLQDKWKTIGPVPEKMNDDVWQRFRKACDSFFERKKDFYNVKNDEEKNNQTAKEALLEKLNSISEIEDGTAAFSQLKEIQKEWMNIGHVPFKIKNKIQENYSNLVDKIYKKHKSLAEENKQSRLKEHFEMLSNSPDGTDRLKKEERVIKDKIRVANEEIETLRNNMEFFAKSKNADALKQQMETKIKQSEGQISKLKDELKLLNSFKTSNPA